jgi:hypothetical protein
METKNLEKEYFIVFGKEKDFGSHDKFIFNDIDSFDFLAEKADGLEEIIEEAKIKSSEDDNDNACFFCGTVDTDKVDGSVEKIKVYFYIV